MELKVTLTDDDNFEITRSVISDTLIILNASGENEFTLALINLLNEISREINRLQDNKNELTHTSIHVRNIFELYLIITHVLKDKKALASWVGQLHKDTSDILEGFASLFAKFGKDVPELAEIKNNIDSTLEDSQYKSKGPFNIKDLAEKYDLKEDYSAIHKLCSKIVHPSSMKVNAYQALIENDIYLSLFLYIGVYFSQRIESTCNDINEHFKA